MLNPVDKWIAKQPKPIRFVAGFMFCTTWVIGVYIAVYTYFWLWEAALSRRI